MAYADQPTWQLACCRAHLLRPVVWIVTTLVLGAMLCAQAPAPGATAGAMRGQASQDESSGSSTSLAATSIQNAVFGSVPEDKPTPGVLQLTFSDAIERALRQNLAGLLSEYNTIQARGEKWQKLSNLLPNIEGEVQEVRQKTSLQALGFSGSLFPGVSFPRVIGPFSY